MPRRPAVPKTIIPGVIWTFAGLVPCVAIAGISSMTPANPRAVGMLLITSPLIVVCRRVLCTSTIGVSPLTVIVSASVPTLSSALTAAVNDPVSSSPSRLTVPKPVSVNVTV